MVSTVFPFTVTISPPHIEQLCFVPMVNRAVPALVPCNSLRSATETVLHALQAIVAVASAFTALVSPCVTIGVARFQSGGRTAAPARAVEEPKEITRVRRDPNPRSLSACALTFIVDLV